MLRVRVVDAQQEEGSNIICSGLLTIWRPTGESDMLKEGRFVGLTGAIVNRVAGHTIHMTAGKHSQYLELEGGLVAGSVDELSRALTPLATICRPKFSPPFNEVDLVGLVVRMEEGTKGSFLTLFITDESSFVVRLLVWEGRGPKECFKEGALIACRDLEWRSQQSAGPLPALYTRETSSLSTNPRCTSASTALAQLKSALAAPGNMLLARARESMVVQRQQRFPTRPSMPSPQSAAEKNPSPIMTPPSATAWGCTAVSRQHARNRQKEAALDSYSHQMASRVGNGMAANVTMSPIPALVSPKATAPYKAPQPSSGVNHVVGPDTQRVIEDMEEMEEEDL